jgi:glycerate-2-kinase
VKSVPRKRSFLKNLWGCALKAVSPEACVRGALSARGGVLRAGRGRFRLRSGNRAWILAAGKASPGMAKAAAERLGARLAGGVVVFPSGTPCRVPGNLEALAAPHPLPGGASVRAARRMEALAERARPGDLALFLISGGASSLLEIPAPGLSLRALRMAHAAFLRSGAPVEEINVLRQALSRVKAGRLGEKFVRRGAAVLTLCLSDHVRDNPAVIGSGPSVAPPPGSRALAAGARRLLLRHGLRSRLPPSVRRVLDSKIPPLPFRAGRAFVAGGHRQALRAMAVFARKRGWRCEIHPALDCGARAAARRLVRALRRLAEAGRPCMVLGGGEVRVKVMGKGRGGRNQEMALRMALAVKGWEGVFGLCAGTDGRDGNSPAAGAFFDSSTAARLEEAGLSPARILEESDSHAAFRKISDSFVTGPTGTNVMDLYLAGWAPPPAKRP